MDMLRRWHRLTAAERADELHRPTEAARGDLILYTRELADRVARRNRRHTRATHVPPLPPKTGVVTPAGLGIGQTWGKQPGRKFGPAPQQAYPQRQKPLVPGERLARYLQTGRKAETDRQHRRITHKVNHARAPFGKRAESQP